MIYLQEEISTMLRDQSLKKETNGTEEPGGNVEKLDEDKNIDTKKEKAGLEEISTITSQELKSKSLKLALDRRFGLLWPTPQVDRYYTGVYIFFIIPPSPILSFFPRILVILFFKKYPIKNLETTHTYL